MIFETHGIDHLFVNELEGTHEPNIVEYAYVPVGADGGAHGNSGVTVWGGTDFSEWTKADNAKLLESNAQLAEKIKPFVGKELKGKAAAYELEGLKLEFSPPEVLALRLIKMDGLLNPLIKAYNKAGLEHFEAFDDEWDRIPRACKTIMFSLTWQYGYIWARNPEWRFWKACVAQEWRKVIAELRDFGDDFPTRREKEANYLETNLPTTAGG